MSTSASDPPKYCLVACCDCGARIQPNAATLCAVCLVKRYDMVEPIMAHLAKNAGKTTLTQCSQCEQWLDETVPAARGTDAGSKPSWRVSTDSDSAALPLWRQSDA